MSNQHPSLLERAIGDAGDLLVVLASDRTVCEFNPAFAKSVGRVAKGVDFVQLIVEHARASISTELVRAAGGEEITIDVPHLRPDGSPIVVEYRVFPVEGGLVAALGRVRGNRPVEPSTLQRVQAELRAKSRMLDEIQLELTQVPFIDPVTGVWNRLQVLERLTTEWSRAERYGTPIACVLVQVEDMRVIRATDGSELANQMLKAVARRVKATCRDHDIVGRYNDDSFVIIGVQSDFQGVRSLCSRLREAIVDTPLSLNLREIHVSVRIGAATHKSEGVEILEDLFRVAEDALEAAVGIGDRISVIHEV